MGARRQEHVRSGLADLGYLIAEATKAALAGRAIDASSPLGTRLQDASLALPVEREGSGTGFDARLNAAPVRWIAQSLEDVALVDTPARPPARPYVEALVRVAKFADRVLTELEARNAGNDDCAEGVAGSILAESVSVMSALRLLHHADNERMDESCRFRGRCHEGNQGVLGGGVWAACLATFSRPAVSTSHAGRARRRTSHVNR